MGVLLVIYLYNFYIFILYVNVWFFIVDKFGEVFIWWFGGGFDFMFFYLFREDVQYWYQVVKNICQLFGDQVYLEYKKWCDDYFFLKYCNEM